MRAIPEEPGLGAIVSHWGEPGEGESPEEEVVAEESPEEESSRKRTDLLCKACRNPVTHTDYRISVDGKHHHVFFNPHGIIFEVGCFSKASGVIPTGTPTLEYTWFDGYAWSIVLCSACLSHLGWSYQSGTGSGFYGLIVTSLVEGGTGEQS